VSLAVVPAVGCRVTVVLAGVALAGYLSQIVTFCRWALTLLRWVLAVREQQLRGLWEGIRGLITSLRLVAETDNKRTQVLDQIWAVLAVVAEQIPVGFLV